jgi:hypothetical protein
MKDYFLPVFSVDSVANFNKVNDLKGDYGILAPVFCSNNLLSKIRELGQPFLIDSGVFKTKGHPWYCQLTSEFINNRWLRELRLASEQELRQKVRNYLDRCQEFSPDYVFALDIIGEPLLSLYLARLSWQEYWEKPRNYALIGVVQVGNIIYNWQETNLPVKNSLPPHYESPKSFLAPLISEYRHLGYQYLALGGLLKQDATTPTGLKFGLSPQQLDDLLTWTRPDFVLGGLALSRLEILKKHRVWADSTNWLWWNGKYDYQRFGERNVLQEVVTNK